MSEPKRATFSTISTQKGDEKKVKDKPKTIRFSLTLPESNEKSCPEYNYRDLLNSAEKKNKVKDKSQGQVNGLNHQLDPFDDDNDDDVKRIAKQFEEKYGLPKQNKKRKGKKDDYADIGAGYDESDSFIDNTDAYDEMVPEDVTTVHGGFYINSGALEFKQVELSGSESSESETSDNEKPSEKPTSRKRIIEDSDESDSEEEKEKEEPKTEHVEKKQKIEANGVQKPAKKKLILIDEKENVLLKKKKVEENLLKKKPITVKDLLREKREEFDMTVPPDSPQKETKPSGSSTINDVIESVVNAGRVVNTDENSKDSSSSSDDPAIVSAASSESESSRDGLPASSDQPIEQPQAEAQKLETDIPIVKLPDNVPENVMKIINDLKKAAENSEGKVKFFSGPVNNMLLSLEINTRKLLRSDRVQIFEHLAPFVKCKKDTLMRRAKNLLLDQERSRLKDPLLRLNVIIDSIMPVVKKNYDKECQKVRDEMFLASATSANSESDVNSKVNKLKFPKKKFPWSEETRKVLQEIIVIQKKYFTLVRTRKETFEENLETFLKGTVLPIWPEGFMSIATLMKHSKLILESIEKRKSAAATMTPISLDIHATPVVAGTPTSPFSHSPVKNMSLSPSCSTGVSGITVIPIPQSSLASPKSAALNGPKLKHSPPIKSSEVSVSVNKKVEPAANSTSVINMSAEISPVTKEIKECNERVPNSLLIPSSKSSVTITSVDLRTNNNMNKKDSAKEDDKSVSVVEHVPKAVTPIPKAVIPMPKAVPPIPKAVPPIPKAVPPVPKVVPPVSKAVPPVPKAVPPIPKTVTPVPKAVTPVPKAVTPIPPAPAPKPTNLKQRILSDIPSSKPRVENNDDCQIIDLTEAPVVIRKPGPKSKTRYPDGTVKLKRVKESSEATSSMRPIKHEDLIQKKSEEISGSQALNQLITGLTKYGSNSTDLSTKPNYKDNPPAAVNEDDMEQVMKDLKELQQLQEHARKNDIDIMAPSSSPVSVIAFNSSYSPSRLQANDLSTPKERKHSVDGSGFQDIFQKHLYQEPSLLKPSQSSSVYNSNVQPKNSYNSVNNFSYSSAGSISNTMNNIRYSQSSSKYTSAMNHLPTNPTGASNHTDEFALFQNFLYQYGFHNTSGPKQKSPP